MDESNTTVAFHSVGPAHFHEPNLDVLTDNIIPLVLDVSAPRPRNCRLMGASYYHGQFGKRRNLIEAEKYYRQADARGSTEAKLALIELLTAKSSTTKRAKKALAWCQAPNKTISIHPATKGSIILTVFFDSASVRITAKSIIPIDNNGQNFIGFAIVQILR